MIKNTISILAAIVFALTFLFTSKVNSQTPCTAWSKLYNGPANLQDSAVAMCVSQGGFVYVTGWSLASAGNADIVTIRYNPATGDTLWVKRFNGATNNEDKPTAITCDNGFVYVTGWSFTNTNRNVVTIKYDASGNQIYASTYNGTGNGGDYGFSVAVDVAGNAFVAGRADVGGAQKYLVLKYDPAGNLLAPFPYLYTGALSTTFDQANSIKLDASGNIYFTGKSGTAGTENFMTIKLNTGAVEQWVKKYNGTQNNEDNALVVMVDNTGSNVYVAGYGFTTGQQQNYITIKYSSANGDSLAAAVYNGPASSLDILTSAAIDNSGNIYVTGFSSAIGTELDFTTIKYNANLSQQWIARTASSDNERPTCLSVDMNSGFVYVTGSVVTGGISDYQTVAYKNDGSLFWHKTETGTAGQNDYASFVVAADSQRVFVTGSANFSATGIAYYTLRYSSCTGIEPISSILPAKFSLEQNYPNPFNPSTSIRFDIPKASFVKITVYDIAGRELEVLAAEQVRAGQYEVKWNASSYASGVYFYSIATNDFVQTKKMILTK